MIVILSPSKSMEMTPAVGQAFTQPCFLSQAERLVRKLRRFSQAELMELMAISPALAELNQQRFRQWQTPFSLDNAKQALFAFTGDVYDGLAAHSLGKRELTFAQQHLRILSGLYGYLRPLDLIQPYRLEMGRAVATAGARNLVQLWREPVTAALNAEPANVLVNLASQEYAKAIDLKALEKTMVTPIFKEEKQGQLKIISFYAKKARGSMARFILRQRIKTAADLLAFAEDGYAYAPALSQPNAPLFVRRTTS